jgi:lactoylglutathione lyase
MTSQTHHDILIELSVPDFQVAKDFYSQLGFEVVWQEDPKDMNGYLVMRRGDSVLCFFCGNDRVYDHPYFSQFPRDTKRGYGVEFSIPATDIDALYSRLRESLPDGHFVQELRLQPWGIKDFRMVDPFGYYFRVNDPTDMVSTLVLGDKSYSD